LKPTALFSVDLYYHHLEPDIPAQLTTMSKASLTSATVIRQVTDAITTFSAPFLRFGVIKMGGRATVVKLQSGGLVVFSPIALTDEVSTTVTSLGGQVSYIVAPDLEHHINLGPWKAAYPTARVVAPSELREKRAKTNREDVPIDFAYTAANKNTIELPEEFTNDLDLEFFDGHVSKDIVLLHKASRTVIAADVIWNYPSNEQYSKSGVDPKSGIFTKIAAHLWMSLDGKSQQRFVWYALSKPNRPSFGESAKKVGGWDFDRLIPCHGDVIETGAKDVFKRIYAWHLADGAKK